MLIYKLKKSDNFIKIADCATHYAVFSISHIALFISQVGKTGVTGKKRLWLKHDSNPEPLAC